MLLNVLITVPSQVGEAGGKAQLGAGWHAMQQVSSSSAAGLISEVDLR